LALLASHIRVNPDGSFDGAGHNLAKRKSKEKAVMMNVKENQDLSALNVNVIWAFSALLRITSSQIFITLNKEIFYIMVFVE
jgi:hypothetical protein